MCYHDPMQTYLMAISKAAIHTRYNVEDRGCFSDGIRSGLDHSLLFFECTSLVPLLSVSFFYCIDV